MRKLVYIFGTMLCLFILLIIVSKNRLNNDNNYLENLVSNADQGGQSIRIEQSDGNVFKDMMASNGAGSGFEFLGSNNNIIYNIVATNNIGSGVVIGGVNNNFRDLSQQ